MFKTIFNIIQGKISIFKARIPKVGEDIYIKNPGIVGFSSGLATVTSVKPGISGGKKVTRITVRENPKTSYNWDQFLSKEQKSLKKLCGKNRAGLYKPLCP